MDLECWKGSERRPSQCLYDPEQEPGSMEEKEFAEGFQGTEFHKPGAWLRFFMPPVPYSCQPVTMLPPYLTLIWEPTSSCVFSIYLLSA